jgi:hypothetical protein
MSIRRVNNLQYARSQCLPPYARSNCRASCRRRIGRAHRRRDDCAALLRRARAGADDTHLGAPTLRRVSRRGSRRDLPLPEVGFSLSEIGSFLAAGEGRPRRDIIERKLAEVTELEHRLEVARAVLEHGQRCPAGEPMRCSRFWSIIDGQLRGLSLEESHALVH